MDTTAGPNVEQTDSWSVTPGVGKPLRQLLLTVPLFLMSLCATIGEFSGWMLAGTGFMAFCMALPLARLVRSRRSVVRLDSAGLVVRPLLGHGGDVAWDDVRHVRIQSVRGAAVGQRIRTVLIERAHGRTLGIPEADLGCSADELLAAIHDYGGRYWQPREDSSSAGDNTAGGSTAPAPADAAGDQAPGRTRAMRGGSGRAS